MLVQGLMAVLTLIVIGYHVGIVARDQNGGGGRYSRYSVHAGSALRGTDRNSLPVFQSRRDAQAVRRADLLWKEECPPIGV